MNEAPCLELSVLIATDSQQVVVVRYGWGSAGGKWGLPRTKLAFGETLPEAVQRLGHKFIGTDVLSGGLITIKELLPNSGDQRSDDVNVNSTTHRVRLVYEGVLLAPMNELGGDVDFSAAVPARDGQDESMPSQQYPQPVEVALVPLDEITTYRLESDVLGVLEEFGLLVNEVQILPPLEG